MQNFSQLNINNLPGYFVTRAHLAERRDTDRRLQQGSWLDNVGEMLFIDQETAFVIPAAELSYVTAEQIRATRLPRLAKLVVSEDAGVNLTLTGHINPSWFKTFSKMTVPQGVETERHFVKCFAPTHEGAIVAYHALRTNDGQISWRCIDQVNGQQVTDVDFLSYEGKIHFTATTLPRMNERAACYIRECGVKALKDNQTVDATWTPAQFTEGHNIANLRGSLQNGQRVYTWLDLDQNALCQAQATDKQPKVLRKNVRGLLTNVTGATNSLQCTIVADDKVIFFNGKDEQIACDLTQPQNQELGRFVRNSKWVNGIVGRNGVAYFSAGMNPLSQMITTQLRRLG